MSVTQQTWWWTGGCPWTMAEESPLLIGVWLAIALPWSASASVTRWRFTAMTHEMSHPRSKHGPRAMAKGAD